MRRIILAFLIISAVHSQESTHYLQTAIRDLRNLNGRQTIKRVDTTLAEVTPQPPIERRNQNAVVPPLSLTKGELANLYQAAVAKGNTVDLKSGDNSYIHAAIHEIDDHPSYVSDYKTGSESGDDSSGDTAGYYYYYYPIKSFLDEITSGSPEHHYSSPSHHEVIHTTHKPHYQYHSHTHQHNVKITTAKEPEEKKDKKALEPLFMAISGFIGMAVMFILSVLVFPKFGIKGIKIKSNAKKNERITDIARVALQAIEGKGCAARFACELEKTARTFNLQDNRFVKLLKRMAPTSFSKQMDRWAKSGPQRLRCTAIPCKKNPQANNNSINNNNNNNNNNKKKANGGVQKKH